MIIGVCQFCSGVKNKYSSACNSVFCCLNIDFLVCYNTLRLQQEIKIDMYMFKNITDALAKLSSLTVTSLTELLKRKLRVQKYVTLICIASRLYCSNNQWNLLCETAANSLWSLLQINPHVAIQILWEVKYIILLLLDV